MDEKVKIPKKHYLGMIKRSNDELPLGFITPWGEDAAARKRMATVDSWASQGDWYNSTVTKVEPQIIDNIPLSGFKFTSSIRNSGYGGHDKWRIEDPRGFELEITSGNLATLMSVGMIDHGEITDQCVWGRQGANNILLSVATEDYKSAVENTVVFNTSASWSNVKLGDTVTLQNNVTGIWMGRMHPIYFECSEIDTNTGRGKDQIRHDTKMVHVIFIEGVKKTHYGTVNQVQLIANPKLSSISPTSNVLSQAEAECLVNNYISSEDTDIVSSNYKTVLSLTFGKAKFTLDKIPLKIHSDSELDALCNYQMNNVYLTFKNGKFGKVETRRSWNNTHTYTISLYDTDCLANNELKSIIMSNTHCGSAWNNYIPSYTFDTDSYEFDSSDNFCNLQLTVTSASGTIIKQMIK